MNHKTDMQAKLQRIASELRAYNPAADEYKGEHIHKVWAREIEAALASRPDAQAGERYDLLQAAVNCPHEIESNRVVLHYSDKQPGHNALAQLRERLARTAAPQAEAAQGVAEGWRELCRRLYVELFHCDQQMRSTRDQHGDPHWTQSAVVRVVLKDAKAALAAAPAPVSEPEQAFQARVKPWMLECFGSEIAADTVERNHRFFEEATEAVQANGMTRSEAHQLVDYTFDRPVGELHQEIGGVMVTLAALCLASGQDMHAAGEVELARISAPEMMAKIRAKQAAKPKHSPLPEAHAAEPRAVGTQKTPTLVNLEGLRERLLAPREIVRDEDGWLTHPEYPVCDEDVRADKLLEAFRIESAFVSMEDDVSHEAYEEYYESGAPDCSSWTPTPPAGNDWRLLEIYDTEDGPYAMFARDAYTAEQERKKENTRKLRAAVDAARAERFAAPSPDREQVGEANEKHLTAEFARVGEAFMDMCSELGCPNNANMLDWARGRMTCDTCNGTGRMFVGRSGQESDGNAPEFERCPSCGYGDASPSRECGEPPFFWHRVIRILVEQGVRWKQDGWVFQSDDDLHKFALAVIGAKGE